MEAGENQKQVSTGSHTPWGPNPNQGGGLTAASLCFTTRITS